jgi:hypothetical protein
LSWQEQLDVASVADSDGQHRYEGADRHLREAQSAGAIQVSHVREEQEMTAAIANALRPVDGLNVRVLVDNVTDSLSTVSQGVMRLKIAFANIGAIVLSHVPSWRSPLSASSDLAKRPHAPVRTTRGARPPGLLCLVFWYPPRRPRSIGRRLRRFGNGFCECDTGLRLVLVETTAFVFETGAATTGFVAAEPSNRRFIHG